MNILIAPDKLKGTLTSTEAGAIMKQAIVATQPDHHVMVVPLADGGDGTLDAFGGANRFTQVTDPLGKQVTAAWRYEEQSNTAIIESAMASGLVLVGGKEKNDAVKALSTGTGELIAEAVSQGATNIIVGIGGSAMSDGGLGAITALENTDLSGVSIKVACDVETLFEDAAKVFGPQKGASPQDVIYLTKRLTDLRNLYKEQYGIDVGEIPGSGAAGGLGGGLFALGATFNQGFKLIATEVGLYDHLSAANVIITAEGKLDSTSFVGKVPGELIALAKTTGTPVVIIAGSIAPDVACDLDNVYCLSLSNIVGPAQSLSNPQKAITKVIREHLFNLPPFVK